MQVNRLLHRQSSKVISSWLTGLVIFSSMIVSGSTQAFDYFQPLPKQPLLAKENPQTNEKIQLGKKLFFDPRLSATNSHSCNTCHNLLTGGDDDRAQSIGPYGNKTKRSAPGLWNIGLQTVLYWDGRVPTLELQAEDHLVDPDIMGKQSAKDIIDRLATDPEYKNSFAKVFGQKDALNFTHIARALASFQRALMAPDSAFDRFIKGDETAISSLAKQGKELFQEKGCSACHFGVNFAGPAPGPAFKNMGDGFYELFPNNLGSEYDQLLDLTSDLGRFYFTKNPGDKYMWRVPPLRNIALTAPYFHNGSAKTFRTAIKVMAKTQFGTPMSEEEVDAIAAFLKSLTGQRPAILGDNQ